MAAEDRSKETPGDDDPTVLFDQMMAETEGLIPKGFAQTVERDLGGSGKFGEARRFALAYLEQPFRESTEKVAADRELAVATAHVSDVLREHIKSYEALLGWIRAAHTRMWMSIAVREDMEEIFAEAKKAGEAARDELQQARFLRSLKHRE